MHRTTRPLFSVVLLFLLLLSASMALRGSNKQSSKQPTPVSTFKSLIDDTSSSSRILKRNKDKDSEEADDWDEFDESSKDVQEEITDNTTYKEDEKDDNGIDINAPPPIENNNDPQKQPESDVQTDPNEGQHQQQPVNDEQTVEQPNTDTTNQTNNNDNSSNTSIVPTEDPENDTSSTSSNSVDLETACRSASRGVPVTTSNDVSVVYEYDLYTTDSALYLGMAVSQAVTNFLMDQYILKHCRRLVRRDLQQTNVRGIEPGSTDLLGKECNNSASNMECYRLQSSAAVYFDSDYEIQESDKTGILQDIQDAFNIGAILTSAVKIEPAIARVDYATGSVDSVTVSASNRSVESNGKKGLKPAGKAFLTLFLLGLIGVAMFVGYKFKVHQKVQELIPPLKSIQLNNNKNKSRQSNNELDGNNSDADDDHLKLRESTTDDMYIDDYDAGTSSINGYNTSISTLKRNSPKVKIGDTIETQSMFGTEMILEDLNKNSYSSSSNNNNNTSMNTTNSNNKNFIYTPSKLPDDKEKSYYGIENEEGDNEHNFSKFDDFSFSDVNVIIDDTNTYDESASIRYSASPRPYKIPDTVQL